MDEIDRGQVLLPEIQRGYVWKGPQAARLMDSLYREFPAGQILLWDPQGFELPQPRHLAGARTSALPNLGQPKVVLDGQQRLTSIYKAIGNAEEKIDVYFNVESEVFQLYQRSRMKNDPRWISVRAVIAGNVDSYEAVERIEAVGGPGPKSYAGREYRGRIDRLRKIAEYKFPIEIFVSDDYDQVTELFVRVNSGTRLREAELALAQLALRMPGAIADKFETAMDAYEQLNYELDPRFIMRAMIALGTGQSRFKHLSGFWSHPVAELNVVWMRTQAAVDAVVNFARLNARFETSDWIPSLNALIPLVAYFDKHKTMRDVDPLLRWFYWATLRGRYSGSAETAMDEDIKAVLAPAPVEELMKNLGPKLQPVAADEFDDAGRLNPLFAMSYAVARANGAKDWWHGTLVGTDVAGAQNRVEIHHIFPKKVLRDLKVHRKDRDEIANLAFLARGPNEKISSAPPSEYLPPIAAKHPERLRAQCIPMDPDLWEPANFQRFLAERRELLAAAVNQMLA